MGAGPSLVMAHGFTQTGSLWGGIDGQLAAHFRVVAADMPGHAGSTSVAASVEQGARLLVEGGGRSAYVGYSMGARVCLQAAVDHPASVDRLVLISGTAGIDDPEDRAERRRTDGALADRLDPPDGSPGTSVATFVRAWLDRPLFDGLDHDAEGMDERLRNTGAGLASSLRLAGSGTQLPLWDRLHRLVMPVLVVTGSRDTKFCALGRRLVASIGANATLAVVPSAGHAPHLQYPDQVTALIRTHLGAPVSG